MAWNKMLKLAMLSSALLSSQAMAQSYFKSTPVSMSFSKGSTSVSKNVIMNEYDTEIVLVQKVDRVVTVCLPPDQTDGWLDDSGKDYFQMPKAEKAQFLKDHILGINKTADLVVEKCIKSKPRTFEAFKSEVQSCSKKDQRLSSLYNNVIVQNGGENRKSLYPSLTPGNQCYSRDIYVWVPEKREVLTGRSVQLNVKVYLTKPAALLSFESETVTVNVNHSLIDGFYLMLNNGFYNNYQQTNRSNNYSQLSIELTPISRKQVSLPSSLTPSVQCNGPQKSLQLNSKNNAALNEILNASSGSKISVSYTDVKGLFNRQISGKWGYAQFEANDISSGNFSRAITEFSFSKKTELKYKLSLENSHFYSASSNNVVDCF